VHFCWPCRRCRGGTRLVLADVRVARCTCRVTRVASVQKSPSSHDVPRSSARRRRCRLQPVLHASSRCAQSQFPSRAAASTSWPVRSRSSSAEVTSASGAEGAKRSFPALSSAGRAARVRGRSPSKLSDGSEIRIALRVAPFKCRAGRPRLRREQEKLPSLFMPGVSSSFRTSNLAVINRGLAELTRVRARRDLPDAARRDGQRKTSRRPSSSSGSRSRRWSRAEQDPGGPAVQEFATSSDNASVCQLLQYYSPRPTSVQRHYIEKDAIINDAIDRMRHAGRMRSCRARRDHRRQRLVIYGIGSAESYQGS